jgi:protein involved in polysaccharide export with SLBB domain
MNMTSHPFALLLALVLASIAASCGSYAGLAVGETRVVETQPDLEPPVYRVQPGDGLVVEFAHHPTRRAEVVVRPDGVLSIPFAEEVRVAGRTIPEADAMLTELVGKRLRDPELTILVAAVAKSQVFVGGEVLRQGAVPLVPGMTAFQALTAAGGMAPTGAADSVILVRADGPGKRIVRRVSLEEGDMLTNDVVLGPFDIVYVPRTAVADVGAFVNANVNAIIPRALSFTAFYNIQDAFE